MNDLSDSQIREIADNIQSECIRQYGNNEEAAKKFWERLVKEVYALNPDAVPVMIQAQPDEENREFMQSIYEGLNV